MIAPLPNPSHAFKAMKILHPELDQEASEAAYALYASYKLVICGHSLGAGVSAAATLLLAGRVANLRSGQALTLTLALT